MKRRFVVRAALAATGALALAAGTAGAHPMDFGTTSDSWINSGVGVHWKSHGAAGAVAGRSTVIRHELAPESRRQGRPGRQARRQRPRGRRLGQGRLRLPDDVLRADLRPRRRADRRHLQAERAGAEGLHPEPHGHVLRRGLAGHLDEHALLQGRPARLPERVVPGHDQRRRRHHARRRAQPERAEEARRGRRRLHQEGRHAVQGRPADARQPDALRVRVDEPGDRQGLRRPRRRHGGGRRRHPRHHQPLQAEAGLRDQPRPVRPARRQAARTATPSSATT